jgi:hypothetical protein
MFNPVLKNGVNVFDVSTCKVYRGDLRYEFGKFVLTGVSSTGTPVPTNEIMTIESILEKNIAHIAANIGNATRRADGSYYDFFSIEVLFMSKKFLEKLKEINPVWWLNVFEHDQPYKFEII